MQDKAEEHIKNDLLAEIQYLEAKYVTIKNFLAGKDMDFLLVGSTLQEFKDSLSRASAFVLTLYNLRGKRVNIPWEPLFTNLDYALATIAVSPSQKQQSAIKTILSMAQTQFEQVMSYFSALKASLK
jgi:hypothetical protein